MDTAWHQDGLTPEEMALLVVLAPMARDENPEFDDLLETAHHQFRRCITAARGRRQ